MMKKTLRKKTLAMAFVILSLLLCSVGVAAEQEVSIPATVTVSSFNFLGESYWPENAFVFFPMQLTVEADTAEYYGYKDQVPMDESVSALDVFVALHEWYYSDTEEGFTRDLLTVTDQGYVTRFWGKDSSYFSFVVNGKAEASKETGYGLTISEMPVKTGDRIYFTEYKDTSWEDGMDECVWFMDSTGTRIDTLRVPVGYTQELQISSYDFMNYSHLSVDEIMTGKDYFGDAIMEPLTDAAIFNCLDTDLEIAAVSDKYGKFTLKFEEPGKYCYTVALANDAPISIFDSYLEVYVYDPMVLSDFSDIGNEWFRDAVSDVLYMGYMNGMEKGIFSPYGLVTREQFVTMLYRLNNSPTTAYTYDVKDVEETRYSKDAIDWACMVGIVNGYEDGTFRPENPISREEMACMIHRYLFYFNIEMKDDVKTDGYSDGAKIQDWALESVEVLSKAGILNGRADGTFDPQGFTTRAEAATVLSNLCDL